MKVKVTLVPFAVAAELITKWVVSVIDDIIAPVGIPVPLTANPTTIEALASCATVVLVLVVSQVASVKLTAFPSLVSV